MIPSPHITPEQAKAVGTAMTACSSLPAGEANTLWPSPQGCSCPPPPSKLMDVFMGMGVHDKACPRHVPVVGRPEPLTCPECKSWEWTERQGSKERGRRLVCYTYPDMRPVYTDPYDLDISVGFCRRCQHTFKIEALSNF